MSRSLPARRRAPFLLALLLPGLWCASASGAPDYGARLERYSYPYPVSFFAFESQGSPLQMAYMDIRPPHGANGQALVLLHGKNFCAASWESVIAPLLQAGWRVIAPDQVGFCKSSKPAHYQFTFQQLASNTRALLQQLGITHFTLMGHSTGGMLAIRYALMFPRDLQQLVLVDPIGLEDWKAMGVPWQSIDAWYQRELKTSDDTVRTYERRTYYADSWRPQYERWVSMYAGMFTGKAREQSAWSSALLYDMICTQPVIYEIQNLQMPVVLMIGDRDVTAIGKDFASDEVKARLGHYPQLGQAAVARIPHAHLVEFPDLGHAPWVQDPAAFNTALFKELAGADTAQTAPN